MSRRNWLFYLVVFGMAGTLIPGHARPLLQEPRLQPVITTLVESHGLDRQQVETTLGAARFNQKILDAISKPAEKTLAWHQYRALFVTDDRIQKGVDFWSRNRGLAEQIENKYGVPAEILIAIIGVETRYGSYHGRYRVLDSLATLAVSDYRRNDFFRDELVAFLRLAYAEGLDPLMMKGSYAGAMGTPQFISSSYLRYAVDEDGDDSRNLWDSLPDILASVANYLNEHGWQAGKPIIHRVLPVQPQSSPEIGKLVAPETPLSDLLDEFSWVGPPPRNADPDSRVTLLSLQGKATVEHYLGFQNFYTITRYNHSPMYAMAVYQLARRIANAYKRQEH